MGSEKGCVKTMRHGGEIYGLDHIQLDFSININPLGIPEDVAWELRESLSLLTCYPDQECRALRGTLSSFTGLPAAQILCGNGASELIEAAVRGLGTRHILLTAPSFSGYLHAARGWGAAVCYHTLRREEDFALTERYLEDLARRPDLAILCTPANPVGNRIAPALLRRIAKVCETQGTWLLVDECFIGFTEDEPETTLRRLLAGPAANQRLLVLDAFTKRFAMPGIRMGYLMAADPALLDRIHAQQPEWSVSQLAQVAGIAAARTSPGYLWATRTLIASQRRKMTTCLQGLGFKVFPGEANYIFFSSERDLYKPLLDRGILIRRCDNIKGLRRGDYRVAIRRPEENGILLRALEEIVGA